MSNTSDFIADATVPAAAAIAESNTLIADAMGYTALPADYKTAIWDAIEATWALGHAPTVPVPVAQFSDPVSWTHRGTWNAFANVTSDPPLGTLATGVGTENDFYHVNVGGTTELDGVTPWVAGEKAAFKDGAWIKATSTVNLDCTLAEAQVIYATQVAHTLWIEHTQQFPWRLTSFSLEECQGLLDPDVLYGDDTSPFLGSWDPTEVSPALQFRGIGNYDPYGTYQIMQAAFSGYTHVNQTQSVDEFLKRFSLGGAYETIHFQAGTAGGMVLSPAQHFSAGNESVTGAAISRRGCHTSGPLLCGLARAVNIPVREHWGITNGAPAHHSMEFLSIRLPPWDTKLTGEGSPFYMFAYDNTPKGAVMTHADWIYDANHVAVGGIKTLVPRGYHEDHVFGQSAANINLAQIRATFHMTFSYLRTEYWLGQYQSLGWATFKTTYLDPYLAAPDSEPWTTRIHRELAARNGEGQI